MESKFCALSENAEAFHISLSFDEANQIQKTICATRFPAGINVVIRWATYMVKHADTLSFVVRCRVSHFVPEITSHAYN